MSNKTKLVLLVGLGLIIIAGFGVYYYTQKNKKTASSAPTKTANNSIQNSINSENNDVADQNLDQADQDFEDQCVKGEWVKIADLPGEMITLRGKLRRVYPDDEIPQELKNFQYYLENETKTALSGSNLLELDNFENREVEVQGKKSSDGKSVEVTQVRCTGIETDKAVIDARIKLMNWIAANINSIAPKKAPYQKWTVDTVEFVDERNVYVEYYDAIEDDENTEIDTDTGRKIILETSPKPDGSYEAKVLAYWEMGEDDYELKTGTDKFEEVTDTYLYQYDPEEKSWTRI
jgi:hypothetical protein